MGIKELLAARKAAAAGLNEVKPVDDTVIDVAAKEIIGTISDAKAQIGAKYEVTMVAPTESFPDPVKEAPKVEVKKPLTFQEKMALKKAQEASTAAPTGEKKEKDTAEGKASATEAVKTANTSLIVTSEEVPEVSQAYLDIKTKIDELSELSDEPLQGAMKELKKALMQNPSAVSLMLDEDIGKMVIALRKMTGVAMAEASKPKEKKAPKAKNVMLTAEQLASAFDEL